MEMTTLDYLKAKTGDTNEALLQSCIEDAEGEVLSYITPDTIPDKVIPFVRKLALWYYNRQGIEGMTSYSEGGTSQAIQTLSPDEMAVLQRYRVFDIGGYPDTAKIDEMKDMQNFDDLED